MKIIIELPNNVELTITKNNLKTNIPKIELAIKQLRAKADSIEQDLNTITEFMMIDMQRTSK